MKSFAFVLVPVFVAAQSASAAHIVTQTRQGDTVIAETHTYANSAGDLRIDERGPRAVAVSASSAASAGSIETPKFEAGDIEDTTIFQSRDRAIVSLEGDVCRKLSADSKPPEFMAPMGGNAGQFNEQMAAAMKQASAAMEQAMEQARKEGMTKEQERAMREYTQPFMEAPAAVETGPGEVRPLGETVRVGRYRGKGFEVLEPGGEVLVRLWMVPTGELRGAAEVRKAMLGMMDTYEEFLDKMGAGSLMDNSTIAVFRSEELDGLYPIRIEDLETGEVTDVIEAKAGGDADYYPDCEEQDMFGM